MSQQKQPIVGTLHVNSKYLFGHTSRNVPIYLFYPYDTHLSPMRVGCSSKEPGNKLCVVEWESHENGETYPRGILKEVLGPAGDRYAELVALLRHYIPLQKQINKLPQELPIHMMQSDVLDMTNCGYTFNIDPPGCRDIDDCFTIEQAGDVVYFTISIANLLDIVREGSLVDTLAEQQAVTFYTNNGQAVGPMLPRFISEDWASMLEGTTRYAISLIGTWNGHTLRDLHFKKTRIHNNKSYTYESILEDTTYAPILREIASFLKGSVSDDPHEWVEQCMVLYNQEVANIFVDHSKGLLRSLAAMSPSLVEQKAATYVLPTKEATHAAFHDTYYTHATSPIRRYADILAQRTLASILWGHDYPTFEQSSLDHLNHQMKEANRFERDVFFHDLMGKEPSGEVNAKVVGLKQREDGSWKAYLQVQQWNGRLLTVPITGDRDPQDQNAFQYISKDQKTIFTLQLEQEVLLFYYCDLQQPNWKRRMVCTLKKKE